MFPRKSGRPSQQTAERLQDHILDNATNLFLEHGYGLTTIDAIVKNAKISKRTFYHRFRDKSDLFRVVVCRIIESLHPPANVPLISHGDLQENLQHLARLMLEGALSSQGIALSRLIIAESARFPKLATIAIEHGGRKKAITIVSELLKRHAKNENITIADPAFAAEQFLQMIITIPQRRAMGLGTPMTATEIDTWIKNTVNLFLFGYMGSSNFPKQE